MHTDIKSKPLLLTVPQVAELLQIGMNQAYNLCRRPDFPAIHIGRNIRINREVLQDWLDRYNGDIIL